MMRTCFLIALAVLVPSLSWAQPTQVPPPLPDHLPDPPQLPEELRNQPPPPPPDDLPSTSELMEQLRLLDQLLRMPPDRLERMRITIEMISALSPEQRVAMRDRLAQMRDPRSLLDTDLAPLARHLPVGQRSPLERYWISLKPNQKQLLRRRFNQLPDAQRGNFLLGEIRRFESRVRERLESIQEAGENSPKSLSE